MLPVDAGIKVPQVQDTYLDANSLDSVKAMGRAKDPQALKEISKKFEAMFVQQMLKTMREANDVFRKVIILTAAPHASIVTCWTNKWC